LALKISQIPFAVQIGLKQTCPVRKNANQGPLGDWTPEIELLTHLNAKLDIAPVYRMLLKRINKTLFKNKLVEEPSLWLDPIEQ
jgi:hypothetical protein